MEERKADLIQAVSDFVNSVPENQVSKSAKASFFQKAEWHPYSILITQTSSPIVQVVQDILSLTQSVNPKLHEKAQALLNEIEQQGAEYEASLNYKYFSGEEQVAIGKKALMYKLECFVINYGNSNENYTKALYDSIHKIENMDLDDIFTANFLDVMIRRITSDKNKIAKMSNEIADFKNELGAIAKDMGLENVMKEIENMEAQLDAIDKADREKTPEFELEEEECELDEFADNIDIEDEEPTVDEAEVPEQAENMVESTETPEVDEVGPQVNDNTFTITIADAKAFIADGIYSGVFDLASCIEAVEQLKLEAESQDNTQNNSHVKSYDRQLMDNAESMRQAKRNIQKLSKHKPLTDKDIENIKTMCNNLNSLAEQRNEIFAKAEQSKQRAQDLELENINIDAKPFNTLADKLTLIGEDVNYALRGIKDFVANQFGTFNKMTDNHQYGVEQMKQWTTNIVNTCNTKINKASAKASLAVAKAEAPVVAHCKKERKKLEKQYNKEKAKWEKLEKRHAEQMETRTSKGQYGWASRHKYKMEAAINKLAELEKQYKESVRNELDNAK